MSMDGKKIVDIRKFIPLGTLDYIVEYEHSTIVGRFEDQDVLVLGFLVVEDFFNLERHSLAGPHAGDLAKPAI